MYRMTERQQMKLLQQMTAPQESLAEEEVKKEDRSPPVPLKKAARNNGAKRSRKQDEQHDPDLCTAPSAGEQRASSSLTPAQGMKAKVFYSIDQEPQWFLGTIHEVLPRPDPETGWTVVVQFPGSGSEERLVFPSEAPGEGVVIIPVRGSAAAAPASEAKDQTDPSGRNSAQVGPSSTASSTGGSGVVAAEFDVIADMARRLNLPPPVSAARRSQIAELELAVFGEAKKKKF
mmetsp:Transcript_22124/g.64207  ORF Transcript_22124/g.64207 Transcript_22124/m.64207 type:complete len:232 (+) Transcript_22124:115-810(+)